MLRHLRLMSMMKIILLGPGADDRKVIIIHEYLARRGYDYLEKVVLERFSLKIPPKGSTFYWLGE